MTGTEIYKRSEKYQRDAASIRLHAPQWKLLLAYDGQRSLAEVALSADVSFAEALPLTEKFLGEGWIAEQPITLDQYLKRTGAPDLSAIGSAVPLAVILHAPKSETAAPVPPPAPSSGVAEKTAPPSPALQTPHFPKLSHDPRTLHLNTLVDYLVSLAGNRSLGQIVVYRVFLRVPPELLQAEEISSVRLTDDSSVVRSVALERAIANAVNEVTRRPLPDSVFAPA